jgi:putative ABC transport system permease protein
VADAADDVALAQALFPAAWGPAPDQPVELQIAFDGYDLELPVEVAGVSGGDFVVVPTLLAGMLRSGFDQRLEYDGEAQVLRRTKDGYRGFRLYARSIDDVAGLRAHFEDGEGIEVRTRAGAIERVKRMEAALTRLFWLVAIVGIVGGIAAMAASLWAAVERKRRDIGLIRLFGVTKQALFGFPTSQAVMIAAAASAVAIAAFHALATTINTVFAADLPLGEKLCTLPPAHLAYAAVLTVATALASSLLAARRATQIDPAEAIREE